MLRLAAAPLAAVLLSAGHAFAAPRLSPPRLVDLRVTNGSTPFLGDGPLLTTVSPNGDGFRDAAHVEFALSAPATVELAVIQTDTARSEGAAAQVVQLAVSGGGSSRVYGVGVPDGQPRAPIVRVQGLDAGFAQPSYAPGQQAELEVATDAKMLTFQVFA